MASEAGTEKKKLDWIPQRKYISQKAFAFFTFTARRFFSHQKNKIKLDFSKMHTFFVAHILFSFANVEFLLFVFYRVFR